MHDIHECVLGELHVHKCSHSHVGGTGMYEHVQKWFHIRTCIHAYVGREADKYVYLHVCRNIGSYVCLSVWLAVCILVRLDMYAEM